MAGENDRLIYVNMTDQTVSIEPFPQDWKLLGGRGLSARILLEQCDPACDPLGPDNVLVMAPGILSGTTAPTSGTWLWLGYLSSSPRSGTVRQLGVSVVGRVFPER